MRKNEDHRKMAASWAKKLMNYGEDLLVFDTETTGSNPDEDVMVEIGMVNGIGETMYHSLVNPGRPISEGAKKIHGITDEDVALAPKAGPVLATFHTMVQGRPLAAYNYAFDAKIVHTSSLYFPDVSGEPKPLIPACAMKIWAVWNGDWNPVKQDYRWVKQTVAAEEAGLDISGAHRALGDALLTLGLLQYLSSQDVG